jgi:predicted RNase H-like HicB family nuclease
VIAYLFYPSLFTIYRFYDHLPVLRTLNLFLITVVHSLTKFKYPINITRERQYFARLTFEGKSAMKYKVNLKKTEEGYAIWVPGLPGCWSQGKSEDDALENIKDAIEAYLEVVDTLTVGNEARYVEIVHA